MRTWSDACPKPHETEKDEEVEGGLGAADSFMPATYLGQHFFQAVQLK